MRNLSENQTQIIESIISEFEKINQPKNNSTNKIFDVNIIYENIKKEKRLISEIAINNRQMGVINNQIVEDDVNKLNDSLNELGIQAVKSGLSIRISRINGKGLFFDIYYKANSSYIWTSPSKYITKIGAIEKLVAYLSSSHKLDEFNSIEEICKADGFINKIQLMTDN